MQSFLISAVEGNSLPKNDQQEAFEKMLSTTLTRIIEFTKFAEAKNAALLTFCSAWLVALLNTLLSGKVDSGMWYNAIVVMLTLFGISAGLCITSFLPKTELSRFTQTDNRKDNLIFFGDIASVRLPEFEPQFTARYMPVGNDMVTPAYIHDLAQQVAVNSRIANRKFQRFNLAATFCFLAIAALVVSAMLAMGQWIQHATN